MPRPKGFPLTPVEKMLCIEAMEKFYEAELSACSVEGEEYDKEMEAAFETLLHSLVTLRERTKLTHHVIQCAKDRKRAASRG